MYLKILRLIILKCSLLQVTVNYPDPSSRVTIIVSPRDLERIMKESTNPPAYEDLTLPPPYEVAVAYE